MAVKTVCACVLTNDLSYYRVFKLLLQLGNVSHQFGMLFLAIFQLVLNLLQPSVLLVQRLVLVSQLAVQLVDFSLVVEQTKQLQLHLLLHLITIQTTHIDNISPDHTHTDHPERQYLYQ